MTAGWNLTKGELVKRDINEEDLWAAFNYVFSDACAKRSTYKFGFIKAILDNLFSVNFSERGGELSYRTIFKKFSENYWNLITKYHLKQMRPTTRSQVSKIEQIFQEVVFRTPVTGELDFISISNTDKEFIIDAVTKECRKNVVGAVYMDFEGQLYGFDLKESGIWINPAAYEFMLKYKLEIERLNYYAWAKFLETINTDEVLVRVLGKLELATPRRNNLSIYRQILKEEFESNNCFYCGCKLSKSCHVDHVIPWSFVQSDHLWNFVLACSKCNTKKKDFLPSKRILTDVIDRNRVISKTNSFMIRNEFKGYTSELMWKIWEYAKMSGFKEFWDKK